jgi:hypothetical protein
MKYQLLIVLVFLPSWRVKTSRHGYIVGLVQNSNKINKN